MSYTVPCQLCKAPVPWPFNDVPPADAVAVCLDADACNRRMIAESSLTGRIEVGDEVQTLDRKMAVRGRVTQIRGGRVYITGATYPGGPETKCSARLEDVALKSKGSVTHG